jgi:hypothetical protein
VISEIDAVCNIPMLLCRDKCTVVKKGPKEWDSILVKDLSILKRPLSSIVVLDVGWLDPG